MKKIELEIIALSHSITQTQSYAVVLGELNGNRKLPIIIGAFEAQAITVALENLQPSRPLTHDLFSNFIAAAGYKLKEVVISKMEEGIFYAVLVCEGPNDVILEIDSRTSDALALAVRVNCSIYTFENILERAEEFIDSTFQKEKKQSSSDAAPEPSKGKGTKSGSAASKDSLSKMTLEELNNLLQQVLEAEDYLRAVAIRDEINKRKTK